MSRPTRLRIRSRNSSTSSFRSSTERSTSSCYPARSLLLLDQFFEWIAIVLVLGLELQHDVAVHLAKAPIGVPCKAWTAADGFSSPITVWSVRPRLSTVSIMPGIETRAPERTDTSSGFFASPNLRPSAFSMRATLFATPSVEPFRILAVVVVIVIADAGGNRETRRHRQLERGHLGQVRALATQQIAHLRAPLGHARAKKINFRMNPRHRTQSPRTGLPPA